MTLLLVALLLQSAVVLPVRTNLQNPAVSFSVPTKLRKDYDKAWARFLMGNLDQKVFDEVAKLLKKDKDFIPGLMIQFYIHYYAGRAGEAERSLGEVLSRKPGDAFALYYLAETAYARSDFARARDLYGRLFQVQSRPELETKYQKTILLVMQNLLEKAQSASESNRWTEAEDLYRQTLKIAPQEASLHGQLASALLRQKKWEAAIQEYRRQIELGGLNGDADKGIAQALTNLGRSTEVSRTESLREPGQADPLAQQLAELEDLGRWGNERGRFQEISTVPSLTREQFAWLLVRYFPQVEEFRQSPQIVVDVQDSWARQEIQMVLGLGVLDPMPNHTFLPAATLSRRDSAIALARLSRLLSVTPKDDPPRLVPGVAPESDLYRDLQLVGRLGLLTAGEATNLDVTAPLSGGEAVLAAEKLLRLVPQSKN